MTARTLAEQFVRVAAAQPDRAAILTSDGGTTTYAELGRAANAVASRLLELGLEKGSVVLVEGARTSSTIAAMLGTLAIGAAYVPTDPAWPTGRLQQIADIVHPDAALLERDVRLRGVETLSIHEMFTSSTSARLQLAADLDPESIAYIIFTSGSTGAPKGVKVSHRSVLALLKWLWSMTHPADLDLSVTSTSFAFDPSVLEIYGPLLGGGSVKVVPSVWECATGTGDATFMASTPAVLRSLVDTRRLPGRLKLLITGGEALGRALAQDLLAANPTMALWNVYGPTEATVLVTAYPVHEPFPSKIPIGTATHGAELRLLGPDGQEVGPNEIGEICILGAQLALGYIPSTEEEGVFVSALAPGGESQLMYRTGDFGRSDPDGLLFFEGRIDEQLKVRGYRIEPGEVEATLLEMECVKEAKVAVTGEGAARRLVAYLIASGDPTAGEVKAWLGARLPEYMVPSQIVFNDAIPLASTGKVDIGSLARRAAAEYRLDGDDVALSTTIEEVSALVRETLEPLGIISPTDNFFSDLGGTSLQFIVLLGKIEKHFGLEVQLDVVVHDTTVLGLARLAAGQHVPPAEGPASTQTVFLIHSYFGGMLRYQILKDYLAKELRVHLVDAQKFERRQQPQRDVFALAQQAKEQILDIDADGPFALVGHSAGGLVALEVARALVRDGKEVSYLGLIDTPMIGSRWDYLWSKCVQNAPEVGRRLLAGIGGRGQARSAPRPSSLEEDGVRETIALVNRGTSVAVKSFRPGLYPGRAVVFRTEEGARMARWRRDLGWGPVIAEIERHWIPGGHVTALDEPHVRELAQVLAASLHRASAAADVHVATLPEFVADLG